MIISHINFMIDNKNDFLENLRSHLESSAEVINRQIRIKEISDTLHTMKNKSFLIYKGQVIDLNIELATLENSLLTTFNIDSIINTYDTLIKRCSVSMNSIDK